VTTTPTSVDHTADLRAALRDAILELAFAAGREAAEDPAESDRLMVVVETLKATLARTAPDRPRT
jgi:hypothetical protein